MNIVGHVSDILLNVLVAMSDRILPMISSVAAALVLLFVGTLLARGLRFAVEYVLEYARLDHYLDKVEFSHLLQRLGVGRSLTRVAGFTVHWGVLTAFLISAAEVAGLPVVKEFVRDVFAFMPSLGAAVLVMGGGLMLARFLGGIVQGAAMANHLTEADFMGRTCYWVMAVFSGGLALGRLGVDAAVVRDYPHFVVAALCLGLATAFGLHHGLRGRAEGGKGRGRVDLHAIKVK